MNYVELVQNLTKVGWTVTPCYILVCNDEILAVYTNKEVAETMACEFCKIVETNLVRNND